MLFISLRFLLLTGVLSLVACGGGGGSGSPASSSSSAMSSSEASSSEFSSSVVSSSSSEASSSVASSSSSQSSSSTFEVTYNDTSAYETGIHRNLFVEFQLGTQQQVDDKVGAAYQQLFFGNGSQTVMYAVGSDMAYIYAPDSDDIRSEGMSYGMMIAVMMNDQESFNRLWRFAKEYMQVKTGNLAGYFSWSLDNEAPYPATDVNPAADGEEYFVMSLFFAHNRWGSGSGVLDYQAEANAILDDMVNKDTATVGPLMDPAAHQIVFSPVQANPYTDPSYHLPAFYELWALWAESNNQYWHDAAQISRDFFYSAAHTSTGLFPEYSSFEGAPVETSFNSNSHNSAFDAHRVIHNMAMDYAWFSKSNTLNELVERLHQFYYNEGAPENPRSYFAVYSLDGEALANYSASSLVAMNAVGALASDETIAAGFVEDLWYQAVPSGTYRYYNGLIHMLGLLHTAGEFKIYGNPVLVD